MDAKRRITIIGTGCVGTSIGLALRRSPDAEHLEIVGHDREPHHAREAQRLGGFDRTEFNLDLALNKARLVILAVPLAALREVLGDVGRLLEPASGAVVTSIAPLMAPALAWAQELLPTGSHFVAGDVELAPNVNAWDSLSGPAAARADLFEKAIHAIALHEASHPSAIRAVTNLAAVLRAQPLFVDAREHDAIRTLVTALPGMVAAALYGSVSEDPGWAEMQKLAGHTLAAATSSVGADASSQTMLALMGRDALLRGLDRVHQRLDALYTAVAQDDAVSLECAFSRASQARLAWVTQTLARSWEVDRSPLDKDSLFDRTLQTLFGEGIARFQRRQP